MVQRIEYAVFPDTPDAALLTTVNKVLGHVQRSELSFRQMRDWLREEGLWNKETIPTVLSLLDVEMEKASQTSLGPWAQRFFGVDDLDGQKTALFERLLDQNTLLVKYVMEALDMEGGGRLHSTYELHRMLTSYVYPGQHIGLPDFQAWIKWMVVSERLKLIGIRWGLTDHGKQVVPKLRMIDVDEFLEEEEEEAELAAAESAAAESAPAESAPVESAPAASAPRPAAAPSAATGDTNDSAKSAVAAAASDPAPQPAAAAREQADTSAAVAAKPTPSREPTPAAKATAAAKEPGPTEEFPDLPPEAPPVDDAVFEKYAAQFEPEEDAPAASEPTETVARPPQRRHTVAPSALVRASTVDVGCSREPLDLADLVDALRSHGRNKGLGGGSLLVAYGLATRMATNEAARHLFLAAILARLSAIRPDGALCELLLERVGGLTPVAVLLERPEALAEVIVRWGFAQGDAASQAIRGVLLDGVIGGRALGRKQDLPTLLAEAPSSEVLVGMLQQGLLRGAPMSAVFWLIREMVRVELWKQPAAKEIAFVPSRNNRMMAYRLRLIDSHFANTSARQLDIARALAKALPPGSVEAAAFEDLAPDDHLRFDCAMVPICQSPCGWQQPE